MQCTSPAAQGKNMRKWLLLCTVILGTCIVYAVVSNRNNDSPYTRWLAQIDRTKARTDQQNGLTNASADPTKERTDPTKERTDPTKIRTDPTKTRKDYQQGLAKLLADSQRSPVSAVEKKCPGMYQEFRYLNFSHPAVKLSLCGNAEAYKKYPDGFPMCLLQNPFSEDMLNVVREDSDIVSILDLQNIRIPFFVYKGPDFISGHIRSTGSWEPALVHWTLRFALKLPDVTFLDMGSNIGAYSIQAAKLGLPVVALDANIRNILRLRLSLDAAKLDATLVWNFIAQDQNMKYLSFLADCNVGGAGREKSDLPDTVPVMPLRSERLSELIKTKNVVMKMDIQGGEVEFLLTSGRLFTDFNVAAVQMEWSPSFIRGKDSLVMANFFISKGYKVWRFPQFSALDMNNILGWGEMDVMWVHKDFIRIM